MFDDEDEFYEPKPSRGGVCLQLGIFGAVMAVAGWITWQMLDPPTAPASAPRDALFAAESEARHLPEFGELRRLARRQLTQAEVARAITLTRHPNLNVRLEALHRLSTVRDGPLRPEAMEAAALALGDENEYVRFAALAALGGMKAREREADVRALLASDDANTRRSAKRALEQMGLPTE